MSSSLQPNSAGIVNNSARQTSPPVPPTTGVPPCSTAGGREQRLAARPPARFSSLRSTESVNQEQEPWGNTLLAQRYPTSGNSYFWRTAEGGRTDFGEDEGCRYEIRRPKSENRRKTEIRTPNKPRAAALDAGVW